MSKKIIVLISAAVVLVAALAIGAVVYFGGNNAERPLSAAELLSLGEKYLLELNYEQALVQFLKVIEVEPRIPRGYTGAAEAYVGLGDMDSAIAVLRDGLRELPGNEEIQAALDKLESASSSETASSPQLKPVPGAVTNPDADPDTFQFALLEHMLSIEFSVDGTVLGVTDLGLAKSKYSSRADYMSNPMMRNYDPDVEWVPTEDTVYSMPWSDDEGSDLQHHFGYIFVQPFYSSGVEEVFIRTPGFLLLEKYSVGDDPTTLLNDFFGIEDVTKLRIGENVAFEDDSGIALLDKTDDANFEIWLDFNNKRLSVKVENNSIAVFSITSMAY